MSFEYPREFHLDCLDLNIFNNRKLFDKNNTLNRSKIDGTKIRIEFLKAADELIKDIEDNLESYTQEDGEERKNICFSLFGYVETTMHLSLKS